MPNIVDMLTNSIAQADSVAERFLDMHVDAESGLKVFDRTWTLRQMAKELNLTTGQISAALPHIPDVEPVVTEGRMKQYSLTSLNRVRNYFGLSPSKLNTDDPVVVSIMSGKGGVAKSTLTIYLSQYLAINGYRVLVLDCDPQATVTTFCLGVIADAQFNQDDTISPGLLDLQDSLAEQIVETTIEGLHLIPACQELQSAELTFTSPRPNPDGTHSKFPLDAWLKLREKIDAISHHYDVVLLDTAPMASNINLSTALASHMIITPITPSPIDYFSTVSYVRAIAGYIDEISTMCNYSEDMLDRLTAHRFVISKQKPGGAHRSFSELLKGAFHENIYEHPFRESTEISNTLNNLNTMYEKGRAVNSESTRIAALGSIDLLFEEIVEDIRAHWDATTPTAVIPQHDSVNTLASA